MPKSITNIKRLNAIANAIRQDIIKMLVKAGSGHSGGPLGMADVFTALYFNVLKHDPNRPNWKERDRVILSNGHICPVWYAALAQAGYFPKRELWTLRKLGSPLQGHPHRGELPGVENTAGPLGQGYAVAVGLAYALRHLVIASPAGAKQSRNQDAGIASSPRQGGAPRNDTRVYCLSSDGEHNEGQTWEAIMFAAKHKLPNLTVIIDRNNIQIDGPAEQVMPLESLRAKYEAFNWHVLEIDGHNVQAVIDVCAEAKAIVEKPVCVIAHTIPGKGVSFMEGDYRWHGKAPNEQEAEEALRELRKLSSRAPHLAGRGISSIVKRRFLARLIRRDSE